MKTTEKLRKRALSFAALLCSAMTMMAEVDGRWYSVEDDKPSSMSPFMMVVCFIVGTICAIFLIGSVLSDKNQPNEDKGCLTTFFIVLIVLGFIGMMSKCG